MMRKGVTALMGAALLWCMPALLQAEASFGHMVRATIPFAFSVGNKAMPAGDYTVSVDAQSGRILLQGPSSFTVMTIPKETKDVSNRGKLVFQQDGNNFALAEVWTPENSTGQILVSSDHGRSKTVKRQLEIQVSPASSGK